MQEEQEGQRAHEYGGQEVPTGHAAQATLKRAIERKWRVAAIAAGLFLFGLLFFSVNIQFPRTPNFDEFHYVPSAKQFLELRENQNWEHPPLGKLLMAIGLALGGDIPFGWRMMSVVFGAWTLTGMYLLGVALLGSEAGLYVAILTLANQLLYVQSRIGMLDTFMFGFIVWGLLAFILSMQKPGQARGLLGWSGIFFGLGTACKWFAVMPWLGCGAIGLLYAAMSRWKTRFEGPASLDGGDWYSPNIWPAVRRRDWWIRFTLVPLLLYCVTFLPYFLIANLGPHATQATHLGFPDFLIMQVRMYEGQLRVVGDHPYMSRWWQWPLLLRPIWYAFDKEGAQSEWVRGVLLLGNPLIMYGGVLAVLACAWGWFLDRGRTPFLILAFYFMLFASWIVIPRRVSFYYYYYPAGMVLSLALGYVFSSRLLGRYTREIGWGFAAASVGMFVYFFPLLAALRIPSDSFTRWMWLRSWI